MTRRVLRGWFALLVATALAIGTVGMAAARPASAPLMEVKAGAEVVADAWLVQLSGAPTADGNTAAKVKAQQKSFRDAAKAAGVKFNEKRSYSSLFNGLAIKASAAQVNKLRTLSGVAAVWPITKHAIPKTKSISPDLAFAIEMTGADVAQNTLGLSGDGIRVAVMDTGIDYNHPDLGGNGVAEQDSTAFPTARVVAGWDFVGNAYTGDNAPVPDAYPDDCNGHGTHVAGIVGADAASPDGATGVAPGVVFGAYRVFGCDGSTTDDVMIAAMEAALADDMDVLNMSIGDAYNNWPGTPTAAASDRLVQRGVVVVASIGNNGPNGIYAAGAPGVGENVIGVASLDNTHATLPVFHVDPLGMDILYGRSDSPLPPTSGSAPLVQPSGSVEGCSAADFAGFPAGAVALVSRGTCSFYQKGFNAQNAGASAAVLYNNAPGRLSPTVAGSPPVTIPVVMITQADGQLLAANLPQTLTWTDDWASEPVPTAGLVSSFSSYGMAADLSLKPDIAAPGGLIRSTYPLEIGVYDNISGTSMAAPHVAGAVALLLEADPGLKAKDVRSVLQNSADPVNWWGNPGLGALDNVHRQGAGMLDIPGAALAEASVTPGKLSLGESTTGTQKHKLQVRNNTNQKLTYTLSFVNALSTGANTFAPTFHSSDASVAFSNSTLTVNKNGTANVWATITPATGPTGGLYGGYIVLTEATSGETLRVPFAGYIGDYQARSILVDTFGGAVPAAFVDTSPTTPFSSSTFGFTGPDDVPYLWLHTDHQARELVVEVISDGGSGAKKAQQIKLSAFHFEFMPRSATAGGYFALPWDGFVTDGKSKLVQIPDGTYVMKVWALKPLSNRNHASSWETYTTDSFTIDRP